MKNITITILSALLAAMLFISPVWGEMATWDEAVTVANNWIVRVIWQEGHWGGYDWAEVEYIQEFTRSGRVIGYFCHVRPIGFIVVSLRKELAPVKAYSDTCNLDPESDEGMADLLKTKMEGLLDAIEQPIRLYGVDALPDVQGLFEIDYRPAWDELCGEVGAFGGEFKSFQATDSVSQVGPLLSSSWHQGEPYNLLCPEGDSRCTDCCPEPDVVCSPFDRTPVGCVATAAAQIMKYWNWPPYGVGGHSYFWDGDDSCPAGGTTGVGEGWLSATFTNPYDWLRMPDRLTNDSSQDEIDSVAELCYEIGVAVEMDYGVCDSLAYIRDMNDAYGDHFLYHTYVVAKRADNRSIWLDVIQGQLQANQPIHYRFVGHQLVLDGWREDGGTVMRQYHMNYGYGGYCDDPNGCNTWYSLDALYGSNDPNEEKMIAYVYPVPALGYDLIDNWTYRKEQFNYRYFVQDANGVNVTFEAGQNFQFLPRIKVECKDGYIRFESTSFENTWLFSIKGTSKAQINIYDGCIALSRGGSIRFH